MKEIIIEDNFMNNVYIPLEINNHFPDEDKS